MPTSYTTNLGLALPVTAELAGTWGDVVNNEITSLLDNAVAGTTTLSSDADVTLTTTTGAANQSRQAILLWTANGTVTRTITAPARTKAYVVINATAGTQSIKLVGAGPTTGITLVAGEKCLAAWNGSDFVKVASTVVAASQITGTLPTANGGTGLTSFTANGVVYASSTSALTTGSALTFDGSSLTASGFLIANAGLYARSGGALTLWNSANGNASSLSTPAGTGQMAFSTGAGEQMRLTDTGLGIGTSSPTRKLTVSGSGVFTDGTNDLTVWNDGSVGTNGSVNLKFNTAGTLKATLDTSGNLGLGVTPSGWGVGKAFQTQGGSLWAVDQNTLALTQNAYFDGSAYRYLATAAASYTVQASGSHIWYTAPSGTAGNPISFTQAMTLDGSGRLLVGTTTAAGMFTVSAPASTTYGTLNAASDGFGYLTLQNNGTPCGYVGPGALGIGDRMSIASAGALPLVFGTNGSERARIDANGNLVVGATSLPVGNGKISAYGSDNALRAYTTSESAAAISVDKATNTNTSSQIFVQFSINAQTVPNGRIVGNGADQVAFASWSDRRLKKNIVDLPSQWSNIKALRPVEFDYIASNGGGHQLGFVAQEVQEVYSDIVYEGKDGMLGLTGLGKNEARLIKALQEAMARIETLEAKVASLETAGV